MVWFSTPSFSISPARFTPEKITPIEPVDRGALGVDLVGGERDVVAARGRDPHQLRHDGHLALSRKRRISS